MKRLPQNLQYEISEKGFVVYNYISFFELMQTVKRDYLGIVSAFNIPLLVVSIVTGMINTALLFYALGISYLIIFSIILWKILWRTQKYLYISRVIFTEKNILIGDNILEYSDYLSEYQYETKNSSENSYSKNKSILSQYEEEFDEYLTRPSRLTQAIQQREKKFKQQILDIFNSGRDFDLRGDSRIGLAILLSVYVYAVSLLIFYYLGIFLGYVFFGIFAFLLKIFLFFSKKIELQMKFSVEKIDITLSDIKKIESVLSIKLSKFSGGEISDISGFVGEKFDSFYAGIQEILEEQKKLEEIIAVSSYKKFINFEKFSGYLKKQYNKPVHNMIEMLGKYSQKISDQRRVVEQEISGKINAEYSAHLSKKYLNLSRMEKEAQDNLEKMRMMRV